MHCHEARLLIHEYLDEGLDGAQTLKLKNHLVSCSQCRSLYNQYEQAEALARSLPRREAPEGLTERIIASLPKPSRKTGWFQWIRRHPGVSVASFFLLVMLGSFLSLWNLDQDMMLKGDLSAVAVEGNTVIVPAGQTVSGNLVVQRGDVRVDGEIDGNLVVIDGSYHLASTAKVSGKITVVNQLAEWIWYKVNEWFSFVTNK